MNQYITTGQKFNRLTAIKRVFSTDKRNSLWLFKCDCGNTKIMVGNNVKRGLSKSCGCLHRDIMHTMITHGYIQKNKQGKNNPRFYAIWSGLRNRCQNVKSRSYSNYGAKGIKVEPKWNAFENFYSDMFESYIIACNAHGENQVSIDRIDNNKGYSKENCRWASRTMQARNKSSNAVYLLENKKMCVAEIIEKYQINKSKFYRRLKKGISIDNIIKELSNMAE